MGAGGREKKVQQQSQIVERNQFEGHEGHDEEEDEDDPLLS
jgi:hypothetical protein